MPRYTTTFDLSLEDMDLLERALQHIAANDDAPVDPRSVSELLGKLHNQKVFYRPKGRYISG